jgi:hypothetical protein
MSKNIIVVTNDTNIADRFLSNIYSHDDVTMVQETVLDPEESSEGLIAAWKNPVNDEIKELGIFGANTSEYAIYRMPISGFCYMMARARKLQDQQISMVVCIKEYNPTMLYKNEGYHLLLDGHFIPTMSLFREWFSTATMNSLLLPEYDWLYEMANEGRIPLLSDRYEDLRGSED